MTDLNTKTMNELNCMINDNGTPHYTQSQLKNVKKAELIQAVTEALARREAAKPAAKQRGERKPAGPSLTVSKTKEVAASKLCNCLKALREGRRTVDELWSIWNFDIVLQIYVDRDKFAAQIAAELAGERKKPSPKAKYVQFGVNPDDYLSDEALAAKQLLA